MSLDKIRFLTAGGTIDKIYFDAKSEYQVGDPNIKIVLQKMHVCFPYTVESILRKDSLDITDADRQILAKAVSASSIKRVVITHGTDTMVKTAQFLANHDASHGKTIVMTGALAPAMFQDSDAVFNIGCAIGAVQTLHSGVYIVMNGLVFAHDNVHKNVEKNRFETLA